MKRQPVSSSSSSSSSNHHDVDEKAAKGSESCKAKIEAKAAGWNNSEIKNIPSFFRYVHLSVWCLSIPNSWIYHKKPSLPILPRVVSSPWKTLRLLVQLLGSIHTKANLRASANPRIQDVKTWNENEFIYVMYSMHEFAWIIPSLSNCLEVQVFWSFVASIPIGFQASEWAQAQRTQSPRKHLKNSPREETAVAAIAAITITHHYFNQHTMHIHHLHSKIDSKLHGHNRLRIKPFRVFSMEELGRLGTAWREKAIMVGRDSFFDLSTAYLGVQRHSCVMSYSIPLISSKMPRHKQFRLQIFTKKKRCKHHLICTWQDTCRHQQSRCRRLGASQWGRGWDAEMEWSQWAGGWGHPLQPEFFTQSNTHNLSTLPVR